ncbi:alpha/beta fold hydrolase [Haladaptatus cibarius]|uniref:alpha/beta fold hydrolase n=1 Tax=Haladaptatus cibarius TaxID=453847 RepID=UPI000679B6B0|nr:alpha/beta hydrolase [Haladaptatus cibarius]
MKEQPQSSGQPCDGLSDTESSLELHDGRNLSYTEYGDLSGTPVFFFHGTPGSRICVPDPLAISSNNVRFITVDRPGYGKSTPISNRSLMDWSDDVAQLADTLGIEEFAVAGLSGGGPYALACGAALPDRVTTVDVISCMAPIGVGNTTEGMSLYNRLGFLLARYTPFVLPLVLRSMARQARDDAEAVVSDARSRYTPSDQQILDDPDIRRDMARELASAYKHSVEGHVEDLKSLARSWEFELAEISIPVRLWHGGDDRNAPLPMAEYLAETIPHSHLTIFPEEGHLIAYEHFDEILGALAEKSVSRQNGTRE